MNCEDPPCKSFPSLPPTVSCRPQRADRKEPTLYRSATGSPNYSLSLCQSPFPGSSHIYFLNPVPGPLRTPSPPPSPGTLAPDFHNTHSSTDDEEGQLASRTRRSHVSAHCACVCGAPERWPVLTKTHTSQALRAR